MASLMSRAAWAFVATLGIVFAIGLLAHLFR
jgi:hypothetical protein